MLNGAWPAWDEANEMWPAGCQSWVSTMVSNRAAMALISGTTA